MESMEINIHDERDGSTAGIEENGFHIYPVSINDSGEGLPYAPIDWPNPGDKWRWKVGKQISYSGYFEDRYLFLPYRLQVTGCKNSSFSSKTAIEQYIGSTFPGADVGAFFASFSWRIPSKDLFKPKGVKIEDGLAIITIPSGDIDKPSGVKIEDGLGIITVSSEDITEPSSSDTPFEIMNTKLHIGGNEMENSSLKRRGWHRKTSCMNKKVTISPNKSLPRKDKILKNILRNKRRVPEHNLQYRSSLKPLCELMNGLKLREEHKEKLKATPFWNIFDAFIKNKLTLERFKKSDENLVELIRTYDARRKAFMLGNELVRIRVSDISLIFGIKSGNEPMDHKYGKKENSAFATRRCLKDGKVSVQIVKTELMKALAGRKNVDVEDVVRLLCLYLCGTCLFPTTGMTIGWGLIKYIEPLEEMGTFAWSKAIYNSLIASLERSCLSPHRVTGCVIALLYWVCEHTSIIEPNRVKGLPRFTKWNLSSLREKLKNVKLAQLQFEVYRAELTPTMEEEGLLFNNGKGKGHAVVEEGEEEQEEEEEEEEMNEELNAGDGEEKDKVQQLIEQIVNLSANNNQKQKKIQELEELVKRLQKEKAKTELQLRNLTRGTDFFTEQGENYGNREEHLEETISNLREKLKRVKQKNVKKNNTFIGALAVKDYEIKGLKAKIEALEVEVQKAEEMSRSSVIARVKRKSRKRKNDEEEVVNVDDFQEPEQKKSKPDRKFPSKEKCPVGILLDQADYDCMKLIHESRGMRTLIWEGKSAFGNVSLEHIMGLMEEEVVPSNVIDAFAEMMMRRQSMLESNLKSETSILEFSQRANKSYILSSMCWAIVEENKEKLIPIFLHQKIKEAFEKKFRYIHFPINTGGHKVTRNHWTLLVLDTKDGIYRHYNSVKPRKCITDPYYKDAEKMKIFVEDYIRTLDESMELAKGVDNAQLIAIEDCPQQLSESVDCGVFVIHVMRQIIEGKQVQSNVDIETARNERKELIHAFLNDIGCLSRESR